LLSSIARDKNLAFELVCDFGAAFAEAALFVGRSGGGCMSASREQPQNMLREYFGTIGAERHTLMSFRSQLVATPQTSGAQKPLILLGRIGRSGEI
jgi:hypothetical protein